MPDNNKKTVVFYHSPCLDGSAAAWMAYKKYGDEATYVGINHDGPDAVRDQILGQIGENQDVDVVFADYSPYTMIMDEILDHAGSVTIYDHHDMAINRMKDYLHHSGIDMPDGTLAMELRGKPVTMVFDRSRSGGVIVHDAFFPSTDRPALLELIQKIDFEYYAIPGKLRGDKAKDDFFSKAAYLDRISREAKGIRAIVTAFEEAAKLSPQELIDRGAEDHQRNKAATDDAVAHMHGVRIPVMVEADAEPLLVLAPILSANLQQCGREFIARLRELAAEAPARVALSHFVDEKGIHRVSVRTGGTPNASDVAAHLGSRDLGHGLGGGGARTSAAAQFNDEQFTRMFNFISKEDMEAEVAASRPHARRHVARSVGGGTPLQL
ncbi:MAG: hypothetical protein IT567_06825 [Alphaproteobacteria bacterium]|nr:hypothetical protein [Alphaproteobacteria bacterium]